MSASMVGIDISAGKSCGGEGGNMMLHTVKVNGHDGEGKENDVSIISDINVGKRGTDLGVFLFTLKSILLKGLRKYQKLMMICY